MLIGSEARTAMLRTAVDSVVAITCIVGAIRTHHRWGRILLTVVAIPTTLFAISGVFIIWLIVQYGPR